MTAREYMSRYRHLKTKVEVLLREKEQLVEAAENATVDMTSEKVQSSGNKDRLGVLTAMIADKQVLIDQHIAEAYQALSEIQAMLDNVDGDAAIVLIRKFIEGKRHQEIAELEGISYATERRRYNRGMKKINDILENDTK